MKIVSRYAYPGLGATFDARANLGQPTSGGSVPITGGSSADSKLTAGLKGALSYLLQPFTQQPAAPTPQYQPSWFDRNKTLIVVGGVGVAAIGIYLATRKRS